MDTNSLTTPSPELKQHAQDLKDHATKGVNDLRKDARNIAGDVKDHASRGYDAIKDEANDRLGDAKDKANDLISAARNYASENPLSAFGFGVLAGLILATWRRR